MIHPLKLVKFAHQVTVPGGVALGTPQMRQQFTSPEYKIGFEPNLQVIVLASDKGPHRWIPVCQVQEMEPLPPPEPEPKKKP